MKKLTALFLIFTFSLLLTSCSGNPKIILDNSDKSNFVDFYTEGDYVYIECVLNIYAEKDCKAGITAVDNEDVEIGLLKNSQLVGIDKADGDEVFTLKAGENKVEVIFRGEYNGVYQITRRDIPRFIEITEK